MTKFVIICWLVAFLCFAPLFTNFAVEGDENIDSEINLIEEILRLGEKKLAAENALAKEPGSCQSDENCLPGGKCSGNGENGKICRCFRGVSGDYCKTFEECVKNPQKCGTENDVKCSYDPNYKIAFCECDDEGKRFDIKSKKCVNQKPCKSYKDCRNGGECDGEDVKYCYCKPGTYGDFCKNIEECENNPNLCGSSDNVECKYNRLLKRAFCHCLNGTQRYDVIQKKCVARKQCNSSNECGTMGACTEKCQDYEPCEDHEYFEGLSSCHCVEGTSGERCEIVDDCYNKVVDCGTGDNVECKYSYIRGIGGYAFCKCTKNNQIFDSTSKLCKDCDCGPMGTGCSFNKGKKVCTCNSQSYDNGDKCEDCKCGDGSDGCKFKDGKKQCICKPGFFVNNSVCEDCKCGEGTESCTFKDGKKECHCKTGYLLNNGKCEKCDCGENSTDCKFENGVKVCTCKSGFVVGNYRICTPVCNDTQQCKNGGRCLQDTCVCLPGSSGPFCEIINECENKLCGEEKNVSCSYNIKTGKAYCKCQNASAIFDPFDKTCKICSCTTKNEGLVKISWKSCEFVNGKKICECQKGYAYDPKKEICSKCACGLNSRCEFDTSGKKICLCEEGFKEFKGACLKCDCGVYGTCRFQKTGAKECTCDQGYSESKGTCFKCSCGPNGKCVFGVRGNVLHCDCDLGFVEDDYKKCKFCYCGPASTCRHSLYKKICRCPKGYQDVNGYCNDVDECLKATSCPKPGMFCLNSPGSFRCECKSGYLYRSADEKNPTPWCEKQQGKTEPNYTPWKIGYGVMSAGFILIFAGLVAVIFKIRRNSDSTLTQPEIPLGRPKNY